MDADNNTVQWSHRMEEDGAPELLHGRGLPADKEYYRLLDEREMSLRSGWVTWLYL